MADARHHFPFFVEYVTAAEYMVCNWPVELKSTLMVLNKHSLHMELNNDSNDIFDLAEFLCFT
jgi:hypothetical protein